ncbi:DUF4240 domain-containing protein [Methylomonas sp. ZR1]|nr:DUF4240 domain-containing protein [Methylomonas sp. ZR1]
MDEMNFWMIIGSAHEQSNGDMDQKCELIRTALSKLPQDDARAFSALFRVMMDRAYSWPLWGAAYVINGGCGDDSFSDFRASLISRGRAAFERALADPDSLAAEDFDEDSWFYEGYQYAVTDGVKAAVGTVVNRESPHPDEPFGQEWEEDKVYELYPQLAEKFA